MQLEIQVALNFLISYLYNKLPRRRVNTFGEELQRQLEAKYQGHWYPERPSKGSGYRCLQVGVKVDPVVERAARQSGLDLADVRHNLPQDLSVWIDPYEVSYQIGDKGPVKVLYVDDSGADGGGVAAAAAAGGADLDKEIRNSFNPEAQVFLPISEPPGGGGGGGVGGGSSPASSSPSPPFGHSAAGSPSFLPRSAQPLTFTTATFAATKFGSTKMKSSGRGNNNNGNGNNNNAGGNHGNNNIAANSGGGSAGNKAARSSPSGLLKQGGVPPSMLSLYGPPPHLKPSALSPNAKEFVFPSLQGPGSPGGSLFPAEQGPLGPLGYGHALDVLAAYGGLGDSALMDGLGFGLGGLQYSHQQYSNQQYSNQQYQPVLAN